MCKTGELISSLQTIQIPVQKSWICRRFLFIKSLVGIDSHIDSQLLGYVYSDNGSSETDTGESAMEKLESVRVILDQKIDHITDYIDNELRREGNNLKVFIQILGWN